MESSQPENHEYRIASKVCTLMSHFYLVHKFIPMPQAMKIPDAKAAVHKDLEVGKSEEQKGGYSGRCCIDGHMSPQECGFGTRSTKAESCSVETL